jgi:hypothetical protein
MNMPAKACIIPKSAKDSGTLMEKAVNAFGAIFKRTFPIYGFLE